jgi:hypothetical protein
MQVTISFALILSRILATLLLTFPLALLDATMRAYEQELIAGFTPQEVMDYLREGQDQSFAVAFLTIGAFSLVYVAALETLAFGLRRGATLFRPPAAPELLRVRDQCSA